MPEGLTFGAYPFGTSARPAGVVSGPPDDIGRIGQALADLAGDGPPLLVRTYVTNDIDTDAAPQRPVRADRRPGRSLANYHDRGGDVTRWCTFVDAVVRAARFAGGIHRRHQGQGLSGLRGGSRRQSLSHGA